MRSFGKGIALALALVLVLGGCVSKSDPKGTGNANGQEAKPVELVVWSNLTDFEVAEVQKVADAWARSTGNKVEVVVNTGDMDAALTAIEAGKGPDIHYGLAHDNLGKFYQVGQLAAVPAGVLNPEEYQPVTISAVSFDGKLMAVPLSWEAVALYYRTDKVKEPPETYDELVQQAKQVGLAYDIKNFYFSYGFIGGNGGYVFKENGGALDPADVGLGKAGTEAGYKLVQDLAQTHKLIPIDMTYDNAKAAFIEGKAAFHINGPWEADNFKKANVPFKVVTLPTLPGGKAFKPFVGVQAAFVNGRIDPAKQMVAWQLMKKFQEELPLALFRVGNRIPAQTALLANAEVKENVTLSTFAQAAAAGVPMPNIPAMGAVWGPAGSALDLLVQGKLEPKAAAEKIAKEIKEAVAQQK